jgi:hypothetical protein
LVNYLGVVSRCCADGFVEKGDVESRKKAPSCLPASCRGIQRIPISFGFIASPCLKAAIQSFDRTVSALTALNGLKGFWLDNGTG